MGRHLSSRYGQVILVSGYPVLTAVNWSQHWCPICLHYEFSCAPKLARKYEIEHWSSKTINWSADSFQINHVTSMSWQMSPRYGHVILVSGYPVLTAVNWPFCECPRCGLAKTRLRHPSLPFDSLPYLTLTICRRVRTYVHSVNHVTTKRKEADHILLVWGAVARVGAPLQLMDHIMGYTFNSSLHTSRSIVWSWHCWKSRTTSRWTWTRTRSLCWCSWTLARPLTPFVMKFSWVGSSEL